jgi:hypothetical protein
MSPYMKQVVVPKMRLVFRQFDRDEFKKFGCETCHGKNAKAREFKMPNPDLFALPGTPAAFAPLMEKKPKAVKFMSSPAGRAPDALRGDPPGSGRPAAARCPDRRPPSRS